MNDNINHVTNRKTTSKFTQIVSLLIHPNDISNQYETQKEVVETLLVTDSQKKHDILNKNKKSHKC